MNEQLRAELIEYRINKALTTLDEVKIHIENQLWNTAVNRLYYACYYAVIALLLKHEIKADTHAGVRQMFGLYFIKTGIIERESGSFYTDIFDMRQNGDYEDLFDFKKEDVISLLQPATELISAIQKLLS